MELLYIINIPLILFILIFFKLLNLQNYLIFNDDKNDNPLPKGFNFVINLSKFIRFGLSLNSFIALYSSNIFLLTFR